MKNREAFIETIDRNQELFEEVLLGRLERFIEEDIDRVDLIDLSGRSAKTSRDKYSLLMDTINLCGNANGADAHVPMESQIITDFRTENGDSRREEHLIHVYMTDIGFLYADVTYNDFGSFDLRLKLFNYYTYKPQDVINFAKKLYTNS